MWNACRDYVGKEFPHILDCPAGMAMLLMAAQEAVEKFGKKSRLSPDSLSRLSWRIREVLRENEKDVRTIH